MEKVSSFSIHRKFVPRKGTLDLFTNFTFFIHLSAFSPPCSSCSWWLGGFQSVIKNWKKSPPT
eukprot:15326336-Ditylum_brightwellii.AAC.1